MVEDMHNAGSLIFFEERMTTSQSMIRNDPSSLFGEALKTSFYLSVPTQTNFVFNKRKFAPFVFFGAWLVTLGAFRVKRLALFLWAFGLALVSWALHTWFKSGFANSVREGFSLLVIVSWAVLLGNFASAILLFWADAADVSLGWVYHGATALLDWNWSGLTSGCFGVYLTHGVRTGLLRRGWTHWDDAPNIRCNQRNQVGARPASSTRNPAHEESLLGQFGSLFRCLSVVSRLLVPSEVR